VFQHLVGLLRDEITTCSNRAIALVALVAQAVVGLIALRRKFVGSDGLLTLAP
jgi:hypothetical protein